MLEKDVFSPSAEPRQGVIAANATEAHSGDFCPLDSHCALVRQIHFAIVSQSPTLVGHALQHAQFNAELFEAGEIELRDYMARMDRLFPDRVRKLSAGLHAKIAELR